MILDSFRTLNVLWRKIRPIQLIAVVLVTGSFISSTSMHAQVAYGINGTVTDVKGARIPGAHVTVLNTVTGVKAEVNTSAAGAYTIILGNPGNYTVTVAAPGFKSAVTDHVMVEVGKFSDVPTTMELGAATQTVEVLAAAVSLNTADPSIGTTIEPELVDAAPIQISGGPRSIDAFVLQTPGTGAPSIVATTGPEGSALNINGGITAESNYYYNGIPISEPYTANSHESGNAYPPYEMVSEARVTSATFSAQYGLAAGVVTYKMAGGTNAYHGDVFEINRNNFFDSVGFFNGPSWGGSDRAPVNHENNYGFTVGGPVRIPHVYNGKNRTFFLFSLDWFRQNEAELGYGTLPTAAELTGDFSNFLDSTGKQIPIYDPVASNASIAAGGGPVQFQCNDVLNVICSNRFSKVSQSLLPLLQPTTSLRTGTGTFNGQQSNEAPVVTSVAQYAHTWGFTVDHNLSDSQSLHFSLWSVNENRPNPGNNVFPNSNELSNAQNNGAIALGYLLNYIKTVSSNLVVTAGVNKTDIDYDDSEVHQGVNFAPSPGGVTFPGIEFDGQFPITSWGSAWSLVNTRRYDNAFVNNWLWTKGKHTFNIGGDVRRTYEDGIVCTHCGGTMQFSYRTTANPNTVSTSNTGSSFASFLLGDVDNANRAYALPADLRNLSVSSYIQDDYKVNPRLTINAGLRWDIPVPFNAVQNDVTFANFNLPNPGADGLLGATTKLGSCALGCANVNRVAIHWKDFGPRLGFSYQFDNKTVVQAGFYVAYMQGGAYAFGLARVAQDYTNLLAGSYLANSTGTNIPGFGNWDTQVIPDSPELPFNPSIGNGQTITQMDPKTAGISPYTQAWSFDVQRELPGNMFLMLAFIGNRNIHLPSSLNQPNMLPLQYLSLGQTLFAPVNSPQAIAAGVKIPYTNFVNDFGGDPTQIPVEQALLPYPQFGGTDNHFDQAGTSFYRSVQLQVEKRFSSGVSFLSNLTLAQNWSDVDFGVTLQQNNAQNPLNQKAEWSVSSLNQKWSNKNMFTYALPFGGGKKFLNHGGLVDEIVGGWQIAGIMNYSSGNPLGIYTSTNNVVLYTNQNGDAQPRPDLVPGQPRKTYSYNRTRDYFVGKTATQPVQFNTNAFAEPGEFTFGSAARNYAGITLPPNLTENFDAMKTFHIGERVKAVLRVDYFNAFNRTQFASRSSPDNDIDDSTFGQVVTDRSNIPNRQGQATFKIMF